MDDSFLVRVLDGVANAGDEFQPVAQLQGMTSRELDEGQAMNVLHREERLRATVHVGHARLVDLRDSGVFQLPEDVGLMFKAAQEGR